MRISIEKRWTCALGDGWKGFCEANGVMTGRESFTLEFICEEEDTTLTFKFCPIFRD